MNPLCFKGDTTVNQVLNIPSGVALLHACFKLFLSSMILLLLIYCFLTFLGYLWNGLRRFLRLFFLPGMIVHLVGHLLIARWLDKTGSLTGVGIKTAKEWNFEMFRNISTKEACLVALTPFFLSILLAFYFRYLFFLTYGSVSLFFGWLAISLFVEGLPSPHDFQLVFLKHIEAKPLAYLLFPWTGIVGVLAYLVYPRFAVVIAGTYFIIITLIFIWPSSSSRNQEDVVI